VRLLKNGLYEFQASPSSVRVYQGEAAVDSGNGQVTVKKGREATLAAVVDEHKFDTATTDDLYNWSSRRSGYLATANVSAAKTMASGYGGGYASYGSFYSPYGFGYGYPYGMGMGMGFGMSGWAWNPLFGMFTYVPYDGMYMNPFGYAFFSPYTVGYVLPAYYGGGVGGRLASGSGPHSTSHGSTSAGVRTSRGAVGARASAPYRTATAGMISRGAANAARSGMSGGASRGGWAGGSGGGGWSGGGSTGASRSMPASTMSAGGHGSVGGGAHR
jgi:hypothetical protein